MVVCASKGAASRQDMENSEAVRRFMRLVPSHWVNYMPARTFLGNGVLPGLAFP
jgi:hypothetical protein